MECKSCKSKNLIEDDARAEMYCDDCGCIFEMIDFHGDTEFHETSNGNKVPIGCIITTGLPAAKQFTVNKAKEKINCLCTKLFLDPYIGSYALEIFKSAFSRGLTKGRGSLVMAGACLYLASRIKRQSIMLLDISDKINVNVYTLGKTYAVIKESFGQKVADIDPCLFIDRFASRLEFGDKTTVVSMTALKLLQRMKKDWISTGRRPCGVTAAALLLAARIHHFERHYEDVARIAGVSESTCRKRLEEWSQTATANLTLTEFTTIDFEEEFDPPAFTEQNSKSKTPLPELTDNEFMRIREHILIMKQCIEEDSNEHQNEKNQDGYFTKLITSVEEGDIPIEELIGDIDDNDSDIEEEINGRRNLIKECIGAKVVRDVFKNISKNEFSMRNGVNKTDELPMTLPISDAVARFPIDNNAELDMTDINDEELLSTYISDKNESVKKFRWWCKMNKDYYRRLKAARERKAEKMKKIEDSSKKPKNKRQKRGSEWMVNPEEVIREIKSNVEDSFSANPPEKIQKLSPRGDDNRNGNYKYEIGYPESEGEGEAPEDEIDIPEPNNCNYDEDEW